jgi:CheY-like chemotaxis protein
MVLMKLSTVIPDCSPPSKNIRLHPIWGEHPIYHSFEHVFTFTQVTCSRTILIVDDNEDDIFIFCRALAANGITNPVQMVNDGREAIAYLEGVGQYADRISFPFPVAVFTDLKMPWMNGIEVLRWLKDNPRCSTLPAVVLTAFKNKEEIEKAFSLGADSCIVKSTRFADFVNLIRVSCDKWWWCDRAPTQPGRELPRQTL